MKHKAPQTLNSNPYEGASQEVCPFARNPFPKCYCSRLSSINAYYVSKYCCGTYGDCKTYQKHQGMPTS